VAAKESDVRWCSDGLELSCDNDEQVGVGFALDCCDGEIMSWVVTTKSIDSALLELKSVTTPVTSPQSNGLAQS
jgi:putative transposase